MPGLHALRCLAGIPIAITVEAVNVPGALLLADSEAGAGLRVVAVVGVTVADTADGLRRRAGRWPGCRHGRKVGREHGCRPGCRR